MATFCKGDAAQGLDLLFDSLMVRAIDEPDAIYGLVAETADIADDSKSCHLRAAPRGAIFRRHAAHRRRRVRYLPAALDARP